MKNLQHQTKQAFFFSLGFYLMALALLVLHISFGPVMFSIALLVSLMWVFMVIREILLSSKLTQTERMLLILFVILFNILAGIVYFFIIRKSVIQNKK